jgi:hypothetical protein
MFRFLLFLGGRYSPRFETVTEGFTSLKMITRTIGEHHATPPPSSKTPTHPYAWDATALSGFESDDLETGKNTRRIALASHVCINVLCIIRFS